MRALFSCFALGSVLHFLPFQSLCAQCADGTPPPCEVRTRQAVARAEPPSADERGRSFLVLPFRNITRSPDHEWLVEGSPTLLADALGQWQEISVVPAERLYPALRRQGLEPGAVMEEEKVRRVAEETGGWTAVAGEVLATGERIRVSARAYDVVTKQVVVRAAEEIEGMANIRVAYERLAGQLLRTAGLDVPAPDLSAATTQSLKAYRAYLRGMAHYNRGEARSAEEAFLEAVSEDSTFAQAYAKLAMASMSTLERLADPQAPAYGYAERAASLAERLPVRERQLVHAVNAVFHGQFGAAREILEQLVAADSSDVEALESLAEMGLYDFILVERGGVERPRGSLNEAARLAKRALSLDPARHQNYATLVTVYALAGGFRSGRLYGVRREGQSLFAFLASVAQPAAMFAVVMRDSMELVPVDSVSVIGRDSLKAAQQRGQDAALAWAGRWLTAAPDEAQAHYMASIAHELAESYGAALVELRKADSLGVEFEIENLAAKRMVVMAKAGRYEDALEVADSLWSAGYFVPQTLAISGLVIGHAAWAFNLNLQTHRLAQAEEMLIRMRDVVLTDPRADTAAAEGLAACFLACRADLSTPPVFPQLPPELLAATFDSLLAQLDDIPRGGILARGVGTVLRAAMEGTATVDVSPEISQQMRNAAARVLTNVRTDLAVSIAEGAVNLDTTEAGRLEMFGLLRRVVEQEPDNLEAHYQLGKIGALTGQQLDLAEAALQKYLEHEPPTGAPTKEGAHWRLGMIYEHRGQTDRAIAAYRAALQVNPGFRPAKQALERLEEGRKEP